MTVLGTYSVLDAVARMEVLGRSGFTVSVCAGPARGEFKWSVQVLSRDGREFVKPYAAESFQRAIEIADTEIILRGWMR